MANHRRRDFMRNGLLSLAALPLGAGALSRRALADSLPRLDPNAPEAQALNYVANASDASDHPAFVEGEFCADCMFFQAANEGCQLFPEYSVEPRGWCQSWVERSG